MSPDVLIEALLFYKTSAQSKNSIAAAIGVPKDELPKHILSLKNRLQNTGLTLVETEKDLQLVTAPQVAAFIDAVRRDDLRTDIGKAGAETLAIILYREPISRNEIDTIRGVNSSVTLRNLLMRGLIERSGKSTAYGYMYTITPQLLTYLGVSRKQDLPNYGQLLDRMEAFQEARVAENA